MPTTLVAGDASSGLSYIRGNDGAFSIQTGPSGSKVTALTVYKNGQVVLPKSPVYLSTSSLSMLLLNTANGYGSTNTYFRRFTNVGLTQGSDFTYADSATLGASITINTTGIYALSYSDQFTGSSTAYITYNDANGTAAPATTAVLAGSTNLTPNTAVNAFYFGPLTAGWVLRARTSNASATGTTNTGLFSLIRLA